MESFYKMVLNVWNAFLPVPGEYVDWRLGGLIGGLGLGLYLAPIVDLVTNWIMDYVTDDTCIKDSNDDSKPNSKSDDKIEEAISTKEAAGPIISIMVVNLVVILVLYSLTKA
jgi:hypothetical protein